MHCDPRRDSQVQHLVGLNGLETFAPRVPKTRKRNGDKPLFPGYVFTRLCMERGDWHKIAYLPGVRKLVEIGGGPCSVDDSIVEAIRLRVHRGTFRPPPIAPGTKIVVTAGAFADLEGIFCEELSGAERVAVLIEMMRRQVRIELSVDEVRPLAG